MSGDSWWLERPGVGLSQGDVVDVLGIGTPVHPREPLQRKTFPGGAMAWSVVRDEEATDANGMLHMLAKGRLHNAIAISHSCDIDKGERKGRILVCPISDAALLSETARQAVFAQLRRSLFPLPAVPGLGDRYTDLRLIQPFDKKALEDRPRLASMTQAATQRLQLQLMGFLARYDEWPAPDAAATES